MLVVTAVRMNVFLSWPPAHNASSPQKSRKCKTCTSRSRIVFSFFQEFLAKFPDPATTFASDEKEMKESYKAHVAAQLKHDFPDFKQSYMNSVTEKHNSHLLPIVREVEAVRADIFGEKRTIVT